MPGDALVDEPAPGPEDTDVLNKVCSHTCSRSHSLGCVACYYAGAPLFLQLILLSYPLCLHFSFLFSTRLFISCGYSGL